MWTDVGLKERERDMEERGEGNIGREREKGEGEILE